MGMVSGVEAGSVVGTEVGSEDDDTGTGIVEGTELARGEGLGIGTGEEFDPGSEDGTCRGEDIVKGAAPGAEAVEIEDKLAQNSFF